MKSLTGCCPGGLRGEAVPGWEALGAGDTKQHDGDERHLLLNSSRLAGDCPGPHGSGTKGLVGPGAWKGEACLRDARASGVVGRGATLQLRQKWAVTVMTTGRP